MHTDIHAKNLELNQALRTFIEEKSTDIERLVGNEGEAAMRWEVGLPSQHHNTGPVFYAEANLTIGGHLLRAESTNYDLHAAIVDVKEELKILVKKFKERAQEGTRHPAGE